MAAAGGEASGPARRLQPLEAALRALNRREHSVHELSERLRAQGFAEEEVSATLQELLGSGAVDDERFAHAFSADKRDLAGWGPERIEAALAERGIAEALIERCVGGESHEALVERARALLHHRGELLEDDRTRARALGFLTRRGYGYEVAYEAIRGLDRVA